MDVSDVGVAVVINDRFSDHVATSANPLDECGDDEEFSLSLPLPTGKQVITVIADPQEMVIEPENRRQNNRMDLKVNIP